MVDRRDPTVWAVLALTAVALLVRFVALGDRPAHWDEARVAYWILEYAETGVTFYRPVIHGPLLKLINAPLFDLFGAIDAVMRVFPALVGGLLPLSALLFRQRLRSEAVVALALLLAFDPVLLYFSRFMRNDILTATFMFAAFAVIVRAIDTRDSRYLYFAAVFGALGFGAKESALAYPIAWLGALVLLADHRLFLARGLPDPWRRRLGGAFDRLASTATRVRQARATGSTVDGLRAGVTTGSQVARRPFAVGIGVVLSFVIPFVAIYAPRGALPSQSTYYRSCSGSTGFFDVGAAPTLGDAIGNPLLLPRLVSFTVGSTAELYACQWITPRTEETNPYLDYLFELGAIAVEISWPILVLAVIGAIVTRYRDDRPDDLVAFTFYWGVASLVGYPFVADIGGAAWLLVNVVVPLSIPAAVALGWLFRAGRNSIKDGDAVSTVIVALIVVILVGSMIGTAYSTSFERPHTDDNPLVQYAQPGTDLQPALSDVQRLADENEGTDVLLYGEYFTASAERSEPDAPTELDRRPRCSNWFNALPLPWYFEASDATVACADGTDEFDDALAESPPVVIVHDDDRDDLDGRLDGYRSETHFLRSTDTPVIFYFDESR
ncbi:MAG: flippase activity-associated protein Agl23 [Natronomonas sp.]